MKKIELEVYKASLVEDQYSINGIALNPKEQVLAKKINEIIDFINGRTVWDA